MIVIRSMRPLQQLKSLKKKHRMASLYSKKKKERKIERKKICSHPNKIAT